MLCAVCDASNAFNSLNRVAASHNTRILTRIRTSSQTRATRILQECNRTVKNACLRDDIEEVKNALPEQTKRAADLPAEKGASSWLTIIPVKDVDLTLNEREFKDAINIFLKRF